MPTRNINLTDHLDEFVASEVASGRYGNASEIVREGLRLLERREQEQRAKLRWLRSAAEEGFEQLDRGDSLELNPANLDKLLDSIEQEVRTESGLKRNRA